MKKTFYLFNPGRLSRKDNTLKFVPHDAAGVEGPARYLPVEDISELYAFGSLDANSALYNFLGKHGISVHFFDYHEHYTGSFLAKEYLLAGKLQVQQTLHYHQPKKRLVLAKKFVEGAAFNLLRNLKYYAKRDRDLSVEIALIDGYVSQLPQMSHVDEVMGLEGNIRQVYYSTFERLVGVSGFTFGQRSRQPPQNELNALISFGNQLCYTLCLDQIYHTQLNPTISFLHEPGVRRFSLALDLAEIFKPMLVDRTIFRVLNKKEISERDFMKDVGGCLLKDGARKTFVQVFEERLKETIKHRNIGRHVTYKHLVRLECYKLTKHLMGMEEYKPFKAWW